MRFDVQLRSAAVACFYLILSMAFRSAAFVLLISLGSDCSTRLLVASIDSSCQTNHPHLKPETWWGLALPSPA